MKNILVYALAVWFAVFMAIATGAIENIPTFLQLVFTFITLLLAGLSIDRCLR